jgi:hypothetical protein
MNGGAVKMLRPKLDAAMVDCVAEDAMAKISIETGCPNLELLLVYHRVGELSIFDPTDSRTLNLL